MSTAAGWIEHEVEDGADVLYLAGAWRLSNLTAIVPALRSLKLRAGRFVLDGSRLEELDTACPQLERAQRGHDGGEVG